VIAWNDTLTTATITIATHRSDGSLLGVTDVRRTALHEAGHLLGLPHNDDPTSIMAAGSRSNVLNERDRASVRLLYRLPWGDIKIR
jgi:predicted Zn-dependent protease